jgi:hypothetical protein
MSLVKLGAKRVALSAGRAAVGRVHPNYRGQPTPRRWHERRAHERAGAWWFGASTVIAILVGSATDLWSTVTTLRLAFALLVAFGLWVMVEKSRRYSHFREYIQPLAKVLGEKLGYRTGYPVEKITVPTDHLTDPDRPSTIRLPEGFSATDPARKQLAKVVAERLGLGAGYDWSYEMAGAQPLLNISVQPAPPSVVTLTDMRDYLEQATDDRLFFGLGRRRTPQWLSWDLDSPHLALSFGSGAGKSTLVRLLAAQTLHLGGRVVILDVAKEGDSHGDWCRDEDGNMLPGVEMYRDAASGHDALVAWADEQRRRSGARWDRTGEDFQRTLIVLEELNSTVPILRAHWARTKERGDAARSPAMDAILTMVCTGRAVKMNVIAVAQQLTAASLGGGAVRENFGVRVLSRFTVNTTKMLIPEITPPPRSSRHKGRMTLAVDGEAFDVQGGYLTEAETITWATNGVAQTDVRQVGGNSLTRENELLDLPREAGAEVRHLHPVPTYEEISLSDFAEREALSLKGLRNARDRDPEFPEPVNVGARNTSLYRLTDLQDWSGFRTKGETV